MGRSSLLVSMRLGTAGGRLGSPFPPHRFFHWIFWLFMGMIPSECGFPTAPDAATS